MNRQDPIFKELVTRLQAGELTRREAAIEYKINPGTLGVWLNRSRVAETIPSARGAKGAPSKPIAPPVTDPDKVTAMRIAVARVLAGEISARAAALADPEKIVMNTLQHKVRQAKKKAGIPIRKNKTRYAETNFAKTDEGA